MNSPSYLLFVDTNIWLDFYREYNETTLTRLKHLEKIATKLIVTFQIESEFKSNRQTVMLDTINKLKASSPKKGHEPGFLLDAKAMKSWNSGVGKSCLSRQ